MTKVSSHIGKEHYKIEIKSSSDNVIIADEPIANGGKNLGFSPKELLAASLSACASATLRMYADRKKWDLSEVKLEVKLKRDKVANKTFIHCKVNLIGNLSEEQRSRLLQIANICPVNKILSNTIEIETELAKHGNL